MDTLPADIKDPTLVWILCGRTEHPAVILSEVDDNHVYVQWTSNGTNGIAHKADIRHEVSGRRRRNRSQSPPPPPPPPPAAAAGGGVDGRNGSRRRRQQQEVQQQQQQQEVQQQQQQSQELPLSTKTNNKRRKIVLKPRVAKRMALPFAQKQQQQYDRDSQDDDSSGESSNSNNNSSSSGSNGSSSESHRESLVARFPDSEKQVTVTVVGPSLTQQLSKESRNDDDDDDNDDSGNDKDDDDDDGDSFDHKKLKKKKSEESEFEPEEETDEDEEILPVEDDSSPEIMMGQRSHRRHRREAQKRKGYANYYYLEEESFSTSESEQHDEMSYRLHSAKEESPSHHHDDGDDDDDDDDSPSDDDLADSTPREAALLEGSRGLDDDRSKNEGLKSSRNVDANNRDVSDAGLRVLQDARPPKNEDFERLQNANARNQDTSDKVSAVEKPTQQNDESQISASINPETSVFDKDTDDKATHPIKAGRSSPKEGDDEGNVFDKDTDDEGCEEKEATSKDKESVGPEQVMESAPTQQTNTKSRQDSEEPNSTSQQLPENHTIVQKQVEHRTLGKVQEVAVDEIDRLLGEVNREYYMYRQFPFIDPSAPLDPNNTLLATKEEWGSEELLNLLKNKMCVKCGKKLGIYFHKYSTERRLMGTSCSTCYFDIIRPLNAPFQLSQRTWSAAQAEAALGIPGLNNSLLSNYRYAALQSRDQSTVFFPDEVVTQCAVEVCGSVWDFHRTMAIHLKKNIKSPPKESAQKQSSNTNPVQSASY